jgi:hypothetical protein
MFFQPRLKAFIMEFVQAHMPKIIGLAICYGVYKYAPNQMAKAAALGVAGVIVAKNVPYLQDALA